MQQAGAPEEKAPQGETRDLVLREHVDTLFRQPLTVLPGGDLLAAAAAVFAGVAARQPVLVLCGLAIAGVGLLRHIVQRRYPGGATLPIAAIRSWYFRYTLLSWLAAAAIGLFGWFGAHTQVPGVRLLAACVVFAATATMMRTGSHPRYVIVQAALAFVPMVIAWATLESPVIEGLAIFALLYVALLSRIAHGMHGLTFGSLETAERNRALAERLEQKNAELEHGEAQLRAQALCFDAALQNMAQGLAMYDAEQRLLVCNQRYLENYGFDPSVVKPGVTMREIVEHHADQYPEAGHAPDLGYRRQAALPRHEEPFAFSRLLGDGRQVDVSYSPMAGGGFVVTTEDVTEQRKARERMDHIASHDPLTDLLNRYELPRRLAELLGGMDSGEDRLAVLALGIDRFRHVNDALGHPAGDALLRAAAERLRALLGPESLLARIGGDEFVCVVRDLRSRSGMSRLAAEIREALAAPYDLDECSAEVGVSIGIAVAPEDGDEAEVLLRNAGVALHRAKAEGRGSHIFFGPDMERLLRERRALENDLRIGIQRGEFLLHYQPLVDTATRRMVACEALLRWRHPERGLLMPADFIPAAEESGLIAQLGEWVLRTACKEAARWPEELKVAVNVSAVQFDGVGLLGSVISALAQAALPPSRLELEITEAVLLRDTEETLAALRKLRELGVRIVMDDFGTGYSSLSYLRIFPFDKIKIDRSFLDARRSPSESYAIVQAVADLAGSLGMTTTAEGVETEEQLTAVRERGCTEAQGFLFAQPMPAAELHDYLSRGAARAA